ncbi:hypothetical protein M3Y96_00279800 [Aphelenchoides besseyi]|nr:hypothetical protein M3Y96_00279800 [Aphelenchoides besseyi]
MERNVSTRMVNVIMANKSDLASSRVISETEGREYAASKGAIYFETSALNGRGIETGMRTIAEQLLEYHRLNSTYDSEKEDTLKRVEPQETKERDIKPRSKSCCTIS